MCVCIFQNNISFFRYANDVFMWQAAVNRQLFCIACTLFLKVLVYRIALTGYRRIRLWLGGRAKREGNMTRRRGGKLLDHRDRIINVV